MRMAKMAVLGLSVAAGVASGQRFVVSMDQPDEDRWNYAFNATPGVRTTAPTFGAIGLEGFDDYDAQFVVGFRTDGQVPAGLGVDRYHIESLVVRAYVSNDEEFVYDPTFDSYRTYLDQSDPDSEPDFDAGRPVEMYIVGYRPPFDILSWTETTEFGGAPVVPPAQGSRFIFAGSMDATGTVFDVSNRLKERFDVLPAAVGQADVPAGELVARNTEFVFEATLCSPGLREHIAQALDAGVLRLTLGSLQAATQGGEVNYPVWYTRENGIAQIDGLTAKLEMVVRVGALADLTGAGDGGPDGSIDADDFFAYLDLFAAGDARADLTGSSNPDDPAYGRANCSIDADDFFFFLDAFVGG